MNKFSCLPDGSVESDRCAVDSGGSPLKPGIWLEWKAWLLALAVAGPLYLFGMFNHDLWRPAEAREAGIACAMIDNGDWSATYLNEELFLEKPPLYTWTIALPLRWLGRQDWVVRLPVIFFTLATLSVVFLFARLQLSRLGAQAAVVSLATMWLFVEVNHGAMIDNGLMLFVALGMLSFYRLSASVEHNARRWAACFYLSLGLAFLTKGCVGPVLMLAAVAGFVVVGRRWDLWRVIYPWTGLAILTILVGGWLVALWLQGGADYYRVFFIDNHLHRFLGNIGPKAGPFYYFPYLLLSPFPWTLLIPAGIWSLYQQSKHRADAREYWRIAGWWFLGMLLILTLAGSKDNQYLLVLLPPLAVVCGAWVEYTVRAGSLPVWSIGLMWLFALVVCLGAALMPLAPFLEGCRAGWSVWGSALGVILLAGIGLWGLSALRQRAWLAMWRRLAFLAVGAGLALGLFVEPALDRGKSIRPLSAMTQRNLLPNTVLYGYGLDENTIGALYFYGQPIKRLKKLYKHIHLAQENEAVALLLMSRCNPNPEVECLLRTGYWRVVEILQSGRRIFWLLISGN